jgi:hypothetical protein
MRSSAPPSPGEALRSGWRGQDATARWILAIVIVMTVVGMGASALTSYALGWRVLRFLVDTLFLFALLLCVATPAAMQRPPKRDPPRTRRERGRRLLSILGDFVLRCMTLILATAVILGLLTAPSTNAAIVIWRICTAASAAIVLNSRLLGALWSARLRLITMAIAGIEIVAFVATLSIDIPAILQSADLAAGVALKDAIARGIVPAATADIFHYMGPHPFRGALDGVLAMPRTHQSLDCAITSSQPPATSGYASQRGVVDYVLPIYVRCSPGMERLASFVTNLRSEATPDERANDIRRCGSVSAGAAAAAIEALRNAPAAQKRIVELFPVCDVGEDPIHATACCTSRPRN